LFEYTCIYDYCLNILGDVDEYAYCFNMEKIYCVTSFIASFVEVKNGFG